MGYRIRELTEAREFCENVRVAVSNVIIRMPGLEGVLKDSAAGEQRVRKLPAGLTLVMCLAMHVCSALSLQDVWVRWVRGSRWLSGVGIEVRVANSAISSARARLGEAPLAALFEPVCQPIAEPTPAGGFAYGWRRWLAVWKMGPIRQSMRRLLDGQPIRAGRALFRKYGRSMGANGAALSPLRPLSGVRMTLHEPPRACCGGRWMPAGGHAG